MIGITVTPNVSPQTYPAILVAVKTNIILPTYGNDFLQGLKHLARTPMCQVETSDLLGYPVATVYIKNSTDIAICQSADQAKVTPYC
jgi:hypothetical protein